MGTSCQHGFVIGAIPAAGQELPAGPKLLIFLFRFVIKVAE